MAIATAGVTPQTNVGVPTPTPTPGSAVTSAAGTVPSQVINQSALAQAIAQAIRSGGPVGPIYQRLSGQPGSIINSLLGGIAPQISTARGTECPNWRGSCGYRSRNSLDAIFRAGTGG